MIKRKTCTHLQEIQEVKTAKAYECEECIKTGSEWVHLRTCQTCGTTLCCDNSVNMHMTKHCNHTEHPVTASAEPGERWMYCYNDNLFTEY